MESDFYLESIKFLAKTKRMSTYDLVNSHDAFLNLLPKKLYKYRKSGDKGYPEFYVKQRKIYTASFNNLGDKFEGVTPASVNRVLKSDPKSLCVYYKVTIIEIIKSRFPTLNFDNANFIFDTILNENFHINKIYKNIKDLVQEQYRKELRNVVSAFVYLFESLQEKTEGDEQFQKGLKMLMDTNNLMGAFCMCETYKNDTLWANYADNFQGYCVEYDLTEPFRSRGSYRFVTNLYPVVYVEKRDDDWFKPLFEMTIKTIDKNGKANRELSGLLFNHWMIKMLCTKKKIWDHEYEWRALGKANGTYLGPLVSAVIVGHEINKTDFEQISSYCKKNKFPMKITDIDYEKQEVIIRDITHADLELIQKRN